MDYKKTLNLSSKELNVAIVTVREAAMLVQQIQQEMVTSALTKGDRSPVTVADYAAQAIVGKRLLDYFPNDPLVGEEDSSALQTDKERQTLERISEFVNTRVQGATPELVCEWIDHGSAVSGQRYWTVDPIDGTKGFLRGDQYAVALALVVDGIVRLGVLGCPNLTDGYQLQPDGFGTLMVAVRTEGTWMTKLAVEEGFSRVHVSERSAPTEARLLRSFESGHTDVSKIDEFADALEVKADPVRLDSQAKYAVQAAGHGEIYLRLLSPGKLDYKEKIWDQAAGSILVEEAGGKVTDLDGKVLDFTQGRTLAENRGICATNELLHEAALEALRKIDA